jgi:glycosyltransferase involved in cell wall biosynthesis
VPITRGMPLDGAPRVTLGIATYNRDTYLAAAIRSGLEQDFADLEVLVVLDGTTNPATEEVLAGFADEPRLRVVRHEGNQGISAAYNTFVSEGRGELIAMLGDDDLAFPGRIRRQVEVFDRYPDTGVVHGDAVVIDAHGRVTGGWDSGDFTPATLVQSFYRQHDYIVDPSRMVHRRVYERVGGYDDRFKVAQDFEFWLRAARHFRFRHCPGEPLIRLRRHGENGSDESQRDAEAAEVSLALRESLERYSLPELVPELDWAVLEHGDAERQALLRLAAHVESRAVPTPDLGETIRARAAQITVPAPRPRNGRRLLMTMFGFNDSGGGTILPRLIAKELARRGWEVTVFHAATAQIPDAGRYVVREWVEDGVRLVGIHNRPSGLFDMNNPAREIDDPIIREIFATELARTRPDVIHFHNLHNLGASLIDVAASYGVASYFTTHNYWLVCPRIYLLDGNGQMCAGPGDGARCADCIGHGDPTAYASRLAEIRSRAVRGTTTILAISDAVRRTLLASGYPAEMVDVVRQAMPHQADIWREVGAERRPGRRAEELTVAFLGSALPHKGPQFLVAAAQHTRERVKVRIHGEVPPQFAKRLKAADARGVVEFSGSFSPSEIGGLLAQADVAALPSTWWDCANLAAEECHAAGLPLLVPRLGGLGETVRDGIDGLTFAGLDAGDLTRQLDRLTSEPGLLEQLQASIAPPAEFSAHVDELEAYYAGARPGRVDTSQPLPNVAVRWQGDHGRSTSLSIINDHVIARLSGPTQRITTAAEALDAPLPHSADVEVRHQWPPDLSPAPAGRLAVIQPWEFGAIPTDWLGPLAANVDELWVPSEYVRRMYLDAGIDPERVVTIPNGVDLQAFTPDGPRRQLLNAEDGTRFLFVGGLIGRKGADLLFSAWCEAFAGRQDVTLVLKDFGADGIYRDADRGPIREHAGSGALPRIVLIEDELPTEELAALYRACDVLVHPYRGEGFAMPVLEAMACGLPAIVTAGGPTDEFLPVDAGWRIDSRRVHFPKDRIDELTTHGRPWVLEPDRAHLVALLRQVDAAEPAARRTRGAAGHTAAQRFSWDAIATLYENRIVDLAGRRPIIAGSGQAEPFPLVEEVALRVLATPAWRSQDRLGELLAEWVATTEPTTSACLYLLANPAVDGAPGDLEARVLSAAAAAGADLDAGADINVLMEPARADRDVRLHVAVDAYVPLHAACAGHERLAREGGGRVVSLGDELTELLKTTGVPDPTPVPEGGVR